MSFENWHFTQLTLGRPDRSGQMAISGYTSPEIDAGDDVPAPLRLLLVDDQYGRLRGDGSNRKDASTFCREFLALEDGSAPVDPGIPVVVFVTDSFKLQEEMQNAPEHYQFDGILQDLKQGSDGQDLPGEKNLRAMRTSTITPVPGVLVVTEHGGEEVLQRNKAGLPHRFAISKHRSTSQNAQSFAEIKAFFRYVLLRRELRTSPIAEELSRFVGIDTLARVAEFIRMVGRDNTPDHRLPIVILGDTGTGKEHLARLIHACDRIQAPREAGVGLFANFIPVLIGAIGEGVIEGELFGIDELAHSQKVAGYVREAANGTLFIDELADIPALIQAKLLRFLETKEVHPIGGSWCPVEDVRVVFATHSEERLHDPSLFRDDFIHRIDGLTFRLPTLAERTDEHPLLIDYFFARALEQRQSGQDKPQNPASLEDTVRPEVAEHLRELCAQGKFSGNVRQLDHFIRRIVRVSDPRRPIGLADLERVLDYSLVRPGRSAAFSPRARNEPTNSHPLDEVFGGDGWNGFVARDRWTKGKMMHEAEERGFKTREIVSYLIEQERGKTSDEPTFLDSTGNPVRQTDQAALVTTLGQQYQRNRANWLAAYRQG